MAEALYRPQPMRWICRNIAFPWVGMALALGLAGCQVVPKRAAPGAEAPPPAPVQPATPGLPEDQTRHRIALLVPMTGPNAAVGQSIANAANLAILDTGGKKLRITTYDTGIGAAAAATRALADGNRLFLGPLLANEVRAVMPVAKRGGVPVIAFSNDASVAGGGVFLMGFSPAQSVERVVKYSKAKGATRFAGLMPSGLYGRNASNALIKAAEDAGATVVSMKNYDRSPKSLGVAIQGLGEQGYDAVLIADSSRLAIQAAPLIRKGGSPSARILGTELWNAETALANASALNGAWYASVSDGMYHQLSSKYRARFGKAPYRLASLGYDAVLLTARIAADWKVGDRFPVGDLTDRTGFSGVDGAFRFGRDGIAERALEVHQIGPNGGTVVSPAPRSFGD